MKASLRWLRKLLPDLPDDPKKVAERLTAAGLEVEGIHAYGAGIEPCLVVAVTAIRPHPAKSGLRLVTVDRGALGPLEVICGAPNVPDPGGLVVLAPLGTTLPAKGMTIEKRSIAGVPSEGMLCSEAELGLTEEGGGILVLPAGLAAPGTPFMTAVPEAFDTVFEIGLTPNRPDCLGHVGLARELATLFELPPPKAHEELPSLGTLTDYVRVDIRDAEGCPHFGAAIMDGATVAPSPLWLRYRLSALAVRSISNLVDVTNLMMLEFGHPMHAYDLDKVTSGEIIVRRAREGEPLLTLDGVKRTLTEDDLVIADAKSPVGLAGVMGGGDSEISEATTRVLLECAYFDPRTVRRAARRHGIHTEASHRFERGVDSGDTRAVLDHALELMCKLSGGTAQVGAAVLRAKDLPRARATLRFQKMDDLLGVVVPRHEAKATLLRLGLVVTTETDTSIEFELPSHRPDLSREVDLIEEVIRVRGLDCVPTLLPAVRPSAEASPREFWLRRARKAATEFGLSEALTYAFVSPRELALVSAPSSPVTIKNPLREEQGVMRTSLLPGLLSAVNHARRHGEKDVRLFTVGSRFLSSDGTLPEERNSFAALIGGERAGYLDKPVPVDVWDAKGLAESVLQRLAGRPAKVVAFDSALRPAHLHPRGAARLEVAGVTVGVVGPLHPDVVDGFELSGELYALEIDLQALELLGPAVTRFVPLPRFPASSRDLALVVKDDVPAGEVMSVIAEAAGPLAEGVRLFDRFTGGQVPANHASLAFRVVYRAADRTLTDAEVDAQHTKVVKEVGAKLGALLRA